MKRFLLAALLVVGCGGGATPAPATTKPATFDITTVRTSFTEECADPIVVDDLFCEQVDIGAMWAEDDILNVPTTLNAAATDRAAVICDLITTVHFDATGTDLGYRYVGILDRDGGRAAACSVGR